MKNFLFNKLCYDKSGNLDYNRASKLLGISKNDLIFYFKPGFDFIDASTLINGVLVGYHTTSTNPLFYTPWSFKTCHHSNADLKYLYEIINNHGKNPAWDNYEFFIMSANGKILYKNLDLQKSTDENGIIHLESNDKELNHLFYPIQTKQYSYKYFFCYGKDFENLKNNLTTLTSSKIIKKTKLEKSRFCSKTELDTQAQFDQ